MRGQFDTPPRGCKSCFNYVEEIERLTKVIQNLKTKVSYYEQAADNKAPPPRPNPYATFAAPSRVSLRPEKSPSFNRRNTTLHVYPPQTGTQEKKGDPSDWFAPDVLIAPPEYYSIENSGPSSDESESETDEEDEDDEDDMDTTPGDSALTSRASSRVSSRNGPSYDKSYLRDEGIDSSAQGSSVASSQVDDEEDSKVDDESEEQSVLDEDEFDFRNCFPYEDNLFALAKDFEIEERIGTGDDAIVYRATRRSNGEVVAIKFRDEWSRSGKHPKELRLLSAVQGHPITCDLVCWHSLPNSKCHAIVTKLCPNTDIEQNVFGDPIKIRQYTHDLMEVIKFLHERNVLYRDVKPDNVLWDEDNQCLSLIDFDVATFYDPSRLHRRLVGTDGYMAPEVLSISAEVERLEKLDCYRNRRNREELLSKLPVKGYGLEADVYSCGVLFGQLLYSYPQEDIMDDDMTERSGEGMSVRALKRLAKLEKLKSFVSEDSNEEDARERMTRDEYREFLALDLLVKMLRETPKHRISVKGSLEHGYFTDLRAFPDHELVSRVVPYDKRIDLEQSH